METFATRDKVLTEIYFAGIEAAEAEGLPPGEELDRKNAVLAAMTEGDAELHAILHRIAALPARTAAGRAAKASVMQRWLADGWDKARRPWANPYECVAWSLAQNAVMAGSAVV